MRPVPVVLRRLAFSLQLSVSPLESESLLILFTGRVKTSRTLSDLSSRVAAVGAGALLDVERTLSCCRKKITLANIPPKHAIREKRFSRLVCEDIHPAQSIVSFSFFQRLFD